MTGGFDRLGPAGILLAGAALVCVACGPEPAGDRDVPAGATVASTAESAGGFLFVDVSEEAGLDRVVHAGRPGKDHLLDSAGTGAAWLDYDLDGRLDLYVVNGWKLDGARVVVKGENVLYRNRGDGSFEVVTDRAGVGGEGHWGCGVAVADYDDDGRPDLLVTTFGPNLLYRNRGDGSFESVGALAGIESPGWNTGAAFFDAEGDGDLDLYVAAYIDQTLEQVLAAERTLDWKGQERVALGPFGLDGAVDHFFLSNGDGTFEEATEKAGLADLGEGYGFGVRAADFDLDGDADLYVANDSDANYLYRNEGNGKFRETGLWSGAAFDAGGAAQAGMGVAVGDADGDGVLDIFVTNFSEDFSTLYVGEGAGFFRDASDESGIGGATYLPLSWGTAFADLDLDGDLDLVVANGHIYPQVDRHPEFEMTYRQGNQLLENLGDGRFVDVSASAGPGFALLQASRGLAAGDYDDDGDVDLLFTGLDVAPVLLRNDSVRRGAWLTVVLEDGAGDGPSIGTRVRIEAGGRTFVRDAASGESYLSVHDPRLHFGLGDVERAERVEVRWPDGRMTVLEDVEVNRPLKVRPQ